MFQPSVSPLAGSEMEPIQLVWRSLTHSVILESCSWSLSFSNPPSLPLDKVSIHGTHGNFCLDEGTEFKIKGLSEIVSTRDINNSLHDYFTTISL